MKKITVTLDSVKWVINKMLKYGTVRSRTNNFEDTTFSIRYASICMDVRLQKPPNLKIQIFDVETEVQFNANANDPKLHTALKHYIENDAQIVDRLLRDVFPSD